MIFVLGGLKGGRFFSVNLCPFCKFSAAGRPGLETPGHMWYTFGRNRIFPLFSYFTVRM